VNSQNQRVPLRPAGLAAAFDMDHSHGQPQNSPHPQSGQSSGWNFEFFHQGIKGKPGINAPAICEPGVFGCAVGSENQFMYVDNTPVTNSDKSKGGLLDPYLTLARTYGWANRMFQTNQGPSYPAHQFIFGATSAPTAPDDAAGVFVAENANPTEVGCAAAPGSSVQLIRPNGNSVPPFGTETAEDSVFPCYTRQSLADLFFNASPRITWTYYSAGQRTIWVAPNSLSSICIPRNGFCTGPYWTKGAANGYIDPLPADVLTDIADCKLTQVNWVTPSAQYSDHSGSNLGQGPAWVAAVVNAIGNSSCTDTVNGNPLTYWQDTIIFITWDDWGGWYDHVPPIFSTNQLERDYQLGFRVPLIVVSAYSPQVGYISNLQYDFGSIVRAIEEIFKLPSLGFADQRAPNDLHDFFNFHQKPSLYNTIAAPLEAAFFTGRTAAQMLVPDTD
jgi:phospholipase C